MKIEFNCVVGWRQTVSFMVPLYTLRLTINRLVSCIVLERCGIDIDATISGLGRYSLYPFSSPVWAVSPTAQVVIVQLLSSHSPPTKTPTSPVSSTEHCPTSPRSENLSRDRDRNAELHHLNPIKAALFLRHSPPTSTSDNV